MGLVVAATLAMAGAATADITLVFGTYAADKPTETVKKYKPFLTYLAQGMTQELGEPVKIKMKIAKEYGDAIDHLADGVVDFARFGPASYVTVNARNESVEIVAMETKKGGKRFNGVIAVHADSPFQSIADLKNHSFAFGDELSTIGRYLSQSLLMDAGISSQDLTHFEYLGRHDRVGAAVGAAKFDAGALKESTFKKQVAAGVQIRALQKFDNVTKPWLAASDMDPVVLAAMRKVMLETTDPAALSSISKSGFVEGFDADYDFVRSAMTQSADF